MQPVFPVPFDRSGERAARRLAAPYAGYPCATTGDGAAKRPDLADAAAFVAQFESIPEAIDAMFTDPILDSGPIGIIHAQRPTIALLYPFDQIVGFRVQPARVHTEDLDLRY